MRTRTRVTIVGGAGLVAAALASGMAAASHVPSQLPAAKQLLEDFAARHRANAPRGDKTTDPGRPLAIQTDPPPATGVLGPVGAPFAASAFTPTTAWAGWTTATTYVQVYAGDAPDHPGQGRVLVIRRAGAHGRLDPGIAPVMTLVAPKAAGGALRIVRVDGSNLILTDRDGRELVFRPATASFG
jgi:hypothetical protein